MVLEACGESQRFRARHPKIEFDQDACVAYLENSLSYEKIHNVELECKANRILHHFAHERIS
jgi:hypothetical protein